MTDIPTEAQEQFVVVGLGGSAGSIPAFREFFRNVPADSDIAYVVILHLSPEHESHLAEVLQHTTALPVSQVHDPVKIAPNRVYVMPPNRSLTTNDGTLLVSEGFGMDARRAPIDIFFRALAETHQARAVCVVLSGTGADGSAGLRRIKDNHGLAIVQEPEEAEFDAMPRSAIATGLADFVLPVGQIPRRVIAYRNQLRDASIAFGSDRAHATPSSTRERLQSLNEDLQIVNQQLEVRIGEISHAHDDMRNLMSSTGIGTIFVDRAMRVKLFTSRIRDIFALSSADVGRSLLDISNKLMIDNLAGDVERVREHLQPVEREVQTRDGRWHLMRLLPYRTADDHIEGTVLTFVDVTDRKRADDLIRAAEERQSFLLDLADQLRSHADPRQITQAAADALTRHVRATRVTFVEMDPERAHDRVVRDIGRDPAVTAQERAASTAAGVGSFVRMILGRNGPAAVALEVHHAGPREWTGPEVQLIRMVADRTWVAVERARAELALRQSEERHRIIIESARDYAIITCDPEGQITSWSPGAEAAFGWTASEVFMQPLALTFVPEDRATGEPEKERREAREHGAAPDVRWHARKDGTRVFIDGISRALATPTGELQGFLKIGQDVTVRRRTEEALRDSEARLRAVTNLVPDLLWSTDARGEPEWFNQRWLDYTGQSFEQARGSGWLETIHAEDREGTRAAFVRALQSGEPLRREHRMRNNAGEYRWFLVQAEPSRDAQGNIVRWFGAAMDIEEQRVARNILEERVRQRTIELEELSHDRQLLLDRLVTATEEERGRIARELHDELGQHITALRLGLHDRKGEPSPQLEAIVQRLDETVDRLTLELRPPVLDHIGLHGAIGSLAEAYEAASGLRVDVHLPAVEGERFSDAIETTIYRVVQEALTNVLRHASASTVSVILEREGDALRMIVEDDGKGFDADNALRGNAARGRFGLLGMRERLALVGGTLSIEAQPGSGTAIYARVPLGDAQKK